ncbi:MAG: AAA family ATPase [Chitinophagaceae bacterium]|nr:AAA family ATPase [Chitinophagaceae bacterium]
MSAKNQFIDIFGSNNIHIDGCKQFIAFHYAIPNIINLVHIDCTKARNWFDETYFTKIKEITYFKKNTGKETPKIEYILYHSFEDLIINFYIAENEIKLFFKKTDPKLIEKITAELRKYSKRYRHRKKRTIELLTNDSRGLSLASLEVSKPKLSIEDNYNDDFKEINSIIIKRLSQKNDKGIVLLHGKPGTGKTTYIRYLLASLKKTVIFLPLELVNSLTGPDLTTFLLKHTNSVLVIEDAEKIIQSRDSTRSSTVSGLLNISDGLLSDFLSIQIICTFNTDISKIDHALLRKGRLIAMYEFKELEVSKAQALSHKLGFSTIIDSPTTLTSIYNQREKDFENLKRPAIGFK